MSKENVLISSGNSHCNVNLYMTICNNEQWQNMRLKFEVNQVLEQLKFSKPIKTYINMTTFDIDMKFHID